TINGICTKIQKQLEISPTRQEIFGQTLQTFQYIELFAQFTNIFMKYNRGFRHFSFYLRR
ncbi:hypothetical protein L9F63_005288, partial [Diploptera punctata]